MSIIKKRGLSEIVSLTIIIILGIIAISSVYVAIYPILDFSPQVSCTELSLTFPQPLESKKACYNSATQEVEVTLFRPTDYQIDTMQFTFSPSNDRFYCGQNCDNARILSEGETQTYYFSVPYAEGMELSYGINECTLNLIKIDPKC